MCFQKIYSQILAQSSNTTLTGKANTYENWDYNNSGLTEEAALAVSIAVSAATGGVGGVILGAGISSLASTGAVNLINAIGRGNNLNDALHETTRNTLTEDNLRNAAVAVIAAGVTYGIDAGVDKWGSGSDFAKNYAGSYSQKIINTTANTAVYSLAEGKTLREFGYSLEDAYKTLAIDTAAEKGANWIGDKYVENRKQDVWESGGQSTNSINSYLTHKASHALLGCAVGAAKAGECGSGAFGGVIGEIIGEEIANNTNISDKWVSATTQISTLFAAGANGLDINVAQQTSKNAVENNYLEHSARLAGIEAEEDCKEGSAIACQAEKILKNHKGDTPTSKILEEETEENKKVLKKYDKSNWFNPIEYFTRAYDLGKEISSKNEKLTEEQLGNGARPSKDLGDGIRHSLTSKEFTDYVGVTRTFIGGFGAEVKGSWNQIKKLELPDFKDSEMDMYNNYIGIRSSITRENINTGNLRTIEETDISTYPIKDWSQYFPTINLNIDKAKNGTLPPQK